MDSIEDFDNLSINMDLDDGTNLSPHWNTDLRRRLPEGPQSHITPFVRDRTTAQTLASVNRFGRNQLSCATDCPPNHMCYPKGEGCILGDERPGKEHCCEYDNSQPAPNPGEFLRTIVVMHRQSSQNPSTQANYSDEGFICAFRRLFGPVLQQPNHVTSNTFYMTGNTPQLLFAGVPHLNAEEKVRLAQLASKMFRKVMVHFVDDASTIRDIKESYRNNHNLFWDCTMSRIGNNKIDVPADFLCVARNINITAVNTELSEQDVFDMIVHKLNDTNDSRSNVVVQIDFTHAGSADFSAITRACHRSSFRGRLLCKITPQTQVTEGNFGSIDIYVQSNVNVQSNFLPPHFVHFQTWQTPKLLIIERH